MKFGITAVFSLLILLSFVTPSYTDQNSSKSKAGISQMSTETAITTMSNPPAELSSSTFWSSAGAALGGFFGVVLFFLFRVGGEILRSRHKKMIKTYLCGNPLNQGQLLESAGDMMHHHGRRIADDAELQRVGIKHPVWEWSRNPVGRHPVGDSVIYGPYTTDFDEPGLYSVIFSIRGVGLSRPQEIMNDRILFELDVSSTLRQYTPVQNGIVAVGALRTIARKYLRISDLAVGEWTDYEMRFHSDTEGLWEYRVLAYDSSGDRPDNIAELGTNVRFLFDKVSIYKLETFKLPWV